MITSCSSCWSLPCRCGRDYQHLSVAQMEQMRKILKEQMGVAALKELAEQRR